MTSFARSWEVLGGFWQIYRKLFRMIALGFFVDAVAEMQVATKAMLGIKFCGGSLPCGRIGYGSDSWQERDRRMKARLEHAPLRHPLEDWSRTVAEREADPPPNIPRQAFAWDPAHAPI